MAISDETALCMAVKNGELSTFSSLLCQGVPISKYVLTVMCESQDGPKFFEAWLKAGGDVNQYYDGVTPLRVGLSSETCTGWLLEHGADPNMAPVAGKRADALALAAADDPPSVVRLLLRHGARTRGTEALHQAATASAVPWDADTFRPVPSRLEVLRLLLAHGADANEMEADPKGLAAPRPRAAYNGTPLHRAARCGSPAAVACLLAHGADAWAPGWSGHTALVAAEASGRADVAGLLRDHMRGGRDSSDDEGVVKG